MFVGNLNKVNLSTSSFERLITKGQFYVDKTRFIEHFLDEASDVQLITRQRRLGKSLNMDTLRCFLTHKEDNRHLFKGLYIEKSHVWGEAHSAPVFKFDFKLLTIDGYAAQLAALVDEQICSVVNPAKLSDRLKRRYDLLVTEFDNLNNSIRLLMEIAYELTGERSYILIDEYDKLLMDNYKSEKYEELRNFIQTLFVSTFKDNPYLEKALLTGVMRVSQESIFSNLNNVKVFDVFSDSTYTIDYGFTEEEVQCIGKHIDVDLDAARKWYNGVRVKGMPIYNTFSFSSFLAGKQFDCFWGMSGTMDIIIKMLSDKRREKLVKLLNGEEIRVVIDTRISLRQLSETSDDKIFFSLLVQAGYLAAKEPVNAARPEAVVLIPNIELMLVWKNFILDSLYPEQMQIWTLFRNVRNLELFKDDLECFLNDRLSYHDLAVRAGDTKRQSEERLYHIFVLGMLSAYRDASCKFPVSNRESGDGRYDILVEKPDGNFIFEFKASNKLEDLEETARTALNQIDTKRYGADLDKSKTLVKIGVAFFGKSCKIECSSDE